MNFLGFGCLFHHTVMGHLPSGNDASWEIEPIDKYIPWGQNQQIKRDVFISVMIDREYTKQ